MEGLRRSFNSLQEHKDITDQISTQRQQREVDDLIAILRKEGRNRQPSMSAWIAIFYWIGFLPIILMATALLLDEVFQGRIEWGIALTLIIFIWMGVGLSRSTVSLRQKRAAHQLAAYQDPRTVSYLVELLAWPDGKIQIDAMHALTKVLPQLRTDHANWLGSRQRRILYSKLSGPYILKEPDFVIAILKSLEQIGDAEALPYVQKLVTIEATLPGHKRVPEAANACLPFLQERVAQSQSRETLLRASSVAATPSEHLLRPAEETSTPPDQLLRPSENDVPAASNTDEEI